MNNIPMVLSVGTKMVKSFPMNRADYNLYRGWTLPANENGEDEGYLVEYTDGGAPNVVNHAGYVSWSPKEQFENAYLTLPEGTEAMPAHQQRVVAEKVQLDKKLEDLRKFLKTPFFASLSAVERELLEQQADMMGAYSGVLLDRIAIF